VTTEGLILFDIDGTLLLSGGAGVRAMGRAFEDVFGVADAFAGIPVAGHTDTFLVSRALERAGVADTPDAHAAFRDAYLRVLPDEITKPGSGRRGLMPGVKTLLDRLAAENRFHCALLTGNYERAAHVKLAHFGVGQHFSWGAFGDDSPDRSELARLAHARARERGVPDAARANTVVIGDTPHDISCARAIDARVIAVATGGYTVDQLKEGCAEIDVVFADLSDTDAVIDALR
jgi:phosphoglycolate phosphatase-like HAD superfamily hydrolase